MKFVVLSSSLYVFWSNVSNVISSQNSEYRSVNARIQIDWHTLAHGGHSQ